MIIKVEDDILNNVPEVFEYTESKALEKFITYLLHSDYRQAVLVEPWIKNLVQNISPAIAQFCPVGVPLDKKYDLTVLNLLIQVAGRLKYVPDSQNWKMPEYWATPDETLAKGSGDCEDGAILLYVLCRLSGVPADRLWLFAGDVVGGGHCTLFYEPDNYPLNFAILDWCYYPDFTPIGSRDLYTVVDNKIYANNGVNKQPINSNYITAWFFFNEDKSTLQLNSRIQQP